MSLQLDDIGGSVRPAFHAIVATFIFTCLTALSACSDSGSRSADALAAPPPAETAPTQGDDGDAPQSLIGRSDPVTLLITSARWNDGGLSVAGTASRATRVKLQDAASGEELGRADASQRRDGVYPWRAVLNDLEASPCRVRAVADDTATEADVDGAPDDCTVADGGQSGSGRNDDDDDDKSDDNGGDTGGGDTGGGSGSTSHDGRFDTYTGSATCVACHKDEVSEVHASVHYQWNGPSPYVVNLASGGKMHGINDFCGYAPINFIGQLTNLDGQIVDGGCATCHVGLGAKPAAATPAQLDNIDCLICHSDSYRRKVEKQSDGSFRFVPAPEKMSVPLLQAITDIQRTPTKGSCVNCHSYAGGGCNNKRGDLEEAHRDPPASFDVHMASKANGGAGLVCVDCHVTAAHRIAGRGVDLMPTDLDTPVRCTNCHAASPHDSARLNRHTRRVDCTVCHIPAFARIVSTDMLRDFSKPPQVDAAKRLYEPYIERAANVTPEYRFWNGMSTFYTFGSAAVPPSGGRVLIAGPLGDISEPLSKIFAFKHHLAVQPRSKGNSAILPVKAGILFQTGNVDAAIKQAAIDVGWDLTQGYDFVPTERYMGIFHEVAPASSALGCSDCHDGTRMDFAALGYTLRATRNGRPLCTSCHADESGEWSPAQLFSAVHAQHVDDENIACTTCHDF
jgi:hypothetical protein